ncbi:MAG: SPOR domain-containing protein [Deltaproteobacteria bacterium]|nr:SPOR domain-containing protein [Deltaproteobacteria bacterium]
MKVSYALSCILISALIIFSSCSGEEEAPKPVQRIPIKIVKPIPTPPPEKQVSSQEAEGKKAEKSQIAAEEEKGEKPQTEAKEENILTAGEVSADKPKEALVSGPEAKTEDEAGKITRTGDKGQGEKALAETGQGEVIEEASEQSEGDSYKVKEGESLLSIAAKKEVYGDPLKWPLLYRYNMDGLRLLKVENFSPDTALPEGMSLHVISLKESRERQKKLMLGDWVVNVLSVSEDKVEELNSAALKLLKGGYSPYITRVKIKDKYWLRLRIGFFKDKADASKDTEKLKCLLGFSNFWITEADKAEIEQFS